MEIYSKESLSREAEGKLKYLTPYRLPKILSSLSKNFPWCTNRSSFSELERDIQSTLHLFQDLDVIINHPEGQEHENASQRNTNWLTAEPQMVRNSIATRCSQKTQKSFSPRRSMPQESQLMLMKSNVVEEDLVEEEAVDRLEYIKQRLTITKVAYCWKFLSLISNGF